MTATALPDDVLPGLAYDMATLAAIMCGYLDDCTASYRQLTARVMGLERPVAATPYALAVAHSPAPGTCFRLLARFAFGARVWWTVAAVALLARDNYIPPSAPDHIAPKARTHSKVEALRDAWQAIDAFRRLAECLGAPTSRWSFAMRRGPRAPAGLDRTGWFVRIPRPP